MISIYPTRFILLMINHTILCSVILKKNVICQNIHPNANYLWNITWSKALGSMHLCSWPTETGWINVREWLAMTCKYCHQNTLNYNIFVKWMYTYSKFDDLPWIPAFELIVIKTKNDIVLQFEIKLKISAQAKQK